MLKISLTIFLIWFVQQSQLAPSIDSFLVKSLKDNGKATVVVSMKDRTSSFLNQLSRTNFQSRAERLNTVARGLQDLAAKSQGNILQILEQESHGRFFTYKSMWLTNQIIIRDATLDLIQKLARYGEIDTIAEEKVAYIDEPVDLRVYDNPSLIPSAEEFFSWGIRTIEAPEVWNEGHRGENVIAATIDTGVRGTHEALKDNFRREFGWYDPAFHTTEPTDNHGHGTHTTANMVGTARNIGVAPRSQWISCRGCTASSCFQTHLLECAQWIACPTDIAKNTTDCTKAPDIVSNSWVGARGATWFTDAILAWRASGIIPLFSIGNTGPDCGTAQYPADNENVIGVGATTIDNILSPFSSVGPTLSGSGIKPDIVAPGSNVFSAYYTSDTAYASMSGTSMACPHAAGTAALILSSEPQENFDFELIKAALQAGSVPTASEGKSCQGIPDSQIPNYHIGHGRINARQSINWFRKVQNL